MPGFMITIGVLFWIAAVIFGVDSMSISLGTQYVTHQMLGSNKLMLAVLCGGFGGMFIGIAGIIDRLPPGERAATKKDRDVAAKSEPTWAGPAVLAVGVAASLGLVVLFGGK